MSVQNLSINGKTLQVEAPDEMPLLWVLRDVLNMVGTKFGCGVGQCGACTVHLDGVATKTCVLPVSAVAGRKVVTIEGISPNGDSPVQKAWCDIDVPQCGYCQAGQIMCAAALLNSTPKPSEEQINAAMGGNLCRCGTYKRIRHAIKVAAGMATVDEFRKVSAIQSERADQSLSA